MRAGRPRLIPRTPGKWLINGVFQAPILIMVTTISDVSDQVPQAPFSPRTSNHSWWNINLPYFPKTRLWVLDCDRQLFDIVIVYRNSAKMIPISSYRLVWVSCREQGCLLYRVPTISKAFEEGPHLCIPTLISPPSHAHPPNFQSHSGL